MEEEEWKGGRRERTTGRERCHSAVCVLIKPPTAKLRPYSSEVNQQSLGSTPTSSHLILVFVRQDSRTTGSTSNWPRASCWRQYRGISAEEMAAQQSSKNVDPHKGFHHQAVNLVSHPRGRPSPPKKAAKISNRLDVQCIRCARLRRNSLLARRHNEVAMEEN